MQLSTTCHPQHQCSIDNQVVALITVEVHARDVIDKLVKANASSPSDFEWASQLRFYWDRDANTAVVEQVRYSVVCCWALFGSSPGGTLRVDPWHRCCKRGIRL